MIRKYHCPLEQLSRAVNTLATTKGRIKERLYFAYTYDLHPLNILDFTNYSKEVVKRFEKIIEKIEKHKTISPCLTAKVFIDSLTEDEACEITREICDLQYLVRME